jgi:hypothetical protein
VISLRWDGRRFCGASQSASLRAAFSSRSTGRASPRTTLVRANAGIWRWILGLLLFGAGVGTMLTSSVNVVQSSFPDKDQGEISGLSSPQTTRCPRRPARRTMRYVGSW